MKYRTKRTEIRRKARVNLCGMPNMLLFSSYGLFYQWIRIAGLVSSAARSSNSSPIITIRRIRFDRLRGHLESLFFFCYRTSVDSVETVGQRDDQSRRRFRVNRWNQLDDAFAFPSRVDVPRNDKFCDSRSCIIRRLGGGGGDVGRLYTRAYSRRWERAKSGGWWVKGEIPVGISFGARVNAEVGRAPSLILHCSFVRGIFQRFALRSSRRNTPTDPVFTRPIVN